MPQGKKRHKSRSVASRNGFSAQTVKRRAPKKSKPLAKPKSWDAMEAEARAALERNARLIDGN